MCMTMLYLHDDYSPDCYTEYCTQGMGIQQVMYSMVNRLVIVRSVVIAAGHGSEHHQKNQVTSVSWGFWFWFS